MRIGGRYAGKGKENKHIEKTNHWAEGAADDSFFYVRQQRLFGKISNSIL